jgi:hypothetical protein
VKRPGRVNTVDTLLSSVNYLPAISRKPQPPPLRWSIYKLAGRWTWIGEVDAATEAEAVENAAAEFKHYAPKLMTVRRGGAARSS